MGSSELEGIEERLSELRRRDRRYARNGYLFVLDALDYTIETLGKDREIGECRHVGGKELLEGLRELAAEQFGPLAAVCLERWGMRTTEDIGEVVFNLIDIGLLSRRSTDSRLDFADGFDFERTFEEKFAQRMDAISKSEVPS